MLSVSKPLQASSAVKYYDRDNYYLESQGQWQGEMASEFGLGGEIQREDFSAFLRGFAPDGEELVASAGKVRDDGQPRHRAGIDLTFSAPKSISVLSCKDKRIETAFNKALSRTLAHIERDFVATRTKKGKQEIAVEPTGKALWSTFTHRTSRELDPQLHAHCILFNLTKDSEGKTKTVHNDAIYKNQKYFGQYFRNEMAKEVKDLGYQVEVTDRKQGFFEIAGVDREVIDAFSKRRQQVEEQARELKEKRFCDLPEPLLRSWVHQRMREERMKPDFPQKFKEEVKALHRSTDRAFKGWRHAELTEFAALNSRVSKENVTEEFVLDLIEKTCEQCGTTLDGVVDGAREAARVSEYQPPQTVEELLSTSVGCLTENQSAFTKTDLITVALRLGIGHYTETDIQHEFSRALGAGDLQRLGQVEAAAGTYDVFSSREMIRLESDVMETCRNTRGTCTINVQPDAAEDFISKTHNDLVEENGFGFTPGQKDAIKHITSTSCQFSVIQGDAGTGKSFSMLYAKQLLEANGIKVRGLAPTGKATVELSESADIADEKCGTIDSFLLKFANADAESKEALFEKNNEVWIVDEAGMCGSKKIHELMKVARFAGAKVVFVGDRKQFASIEAGKMFSELQDKAGVDMVVMPDVMRQKTQQTKDIVKAISLQDVDFAFNALAGKREITDEAKLDKNNYYPGQTLIATRALPGVPRGTEATITEVGETTVSFSYLDPSDETVHSVSFDPTQYIDSFRLFSVARPTQGLSVEDEYHNVIEAVDDREQRLSVVAYDYLRNTALGKTTMVITATNKDRNHLNTLIRDKLLEEHKVQNCGEYIVLESNSLGGAASRMADSYQADQVFTANKGLFTKSGEQISRGTQGRILSANIAENILTLSYSDPETGRDCEHEVDLASNGDRLSTFNENAKNFGSGDKIVFLKNDKKIGVRNGQLAQVESIDKHGNVAARIGKKRIDFNLCGKGGKQYNYIDHAFALSEYKSQGATVDRLVWHADTQNQVSSNSFYVAITRCKREVAVYTDDPERLKQRVKEEQHKYSTLDFTDTPKRGAVPEHMPPMQRIVRDPSTFGRQTTRSGTSPKRRQHRTDIQPTHQQSHLDI